MGTTIKNTGLDFEITKDTVLKFEGNLFTNQLNVKVAECTPIDGDYAGNFQTVCREMVRAFNDRKANALIIAELLEALREAHLTADREYWESFDTGRAMLKKWADLITKAEGGNNG